MVLHRPPGGRSLEQSRGSVVKPTHKNKNRGPPSFPMSDFNGLYAEYTDRAAAPMRAQSTLYNLYCDLAYAMRQLVRSHAELVLIVVLFAVAAAVFVAERTRLLDPTHLSVQT